MDLKEASQRIAQSDKVVGFSGAGISTESGIPDFRSPNGVWANNRTVTYDEFLESEADLSGERIAELVHAAVESAILEMFTWPSGDFSFDVRVMLMDDTLVVEADPKEGSYACSQGPHQVLFQRVATCE